MALWLRPSTHGHMTIMPRTRNNILMGITEVWPRVTIPMSFCSASRIGPCSICSSKKACISRAPTSSSPHHHICRPLAGYEDESPRKLATHLIQSLHALQTYAKGIARLLAPLLQQGPRLTIFIGQRLTIVTTRNTWSNLDHLHKTIPKTVAINS